MRTYLSDLLDVDQLELEIEDGWVRRRTHIDDHLVILNYTEKTQFDKHWNEITVQTRGLVYDQRTGQVVARPFGKFFNYGEHGDGSLRMMARVEVTDKLDGSLGILYPDSLDSVAIATRGSFQSDQAIHATELLRREYTDHTAGTLWWPIFGWTYLFEIVYPENRIVLDYGDLDDLVLLGAVNIETGEQKGPDFDGYWPGPRAEIFAYETLAQALAAEPRSNAEGLVVRYPDTGQRVKIKQEDYVRLHKLVTGLNERAVWEHLAIYKGKLESLISEIPDEFHDWVRQVAFGFVLDHDDLVGRAHAQYDEITSYLAVGWGAQPDPSDRDYRKAFAVEAQRERELTPLLFQLLDGKDVTPSVWKMLKPKGETRSLMNRTEDNS